MVGEIDIPVLLEKRFLNLDRKSVFFLIASPRMLHNYYNGIEIR